MTKDEKDLYIREAAALLLGAMLTGYRPSPPPPEPVPPSPPYSYGPGALEEEEQRYQTARKQWEHKMNLERADFAMHAFAFAAALAAEAELYEGPQDSEGQPIDARALNRECIHGRKPDEQCDECDHAEAMRLAGLAGQGSGDTGNPA